jgi:hypothetical protein
MKLQFDPEKQTLLLNIQNYSIPKVLKQYAQIHSFNQKEEFHITLVGNQTGVILKEKILANGLDGHRLLELAKEHDWNYKMNDDFSHMRKDYGEHIRDSLIQKIQLSHLESFYHKIIDYYKISIKLPFPHITFYAKGDKNQGIGIYSEQDFLKHKFKKVK